MSRPPAVLLSVTGIGARKPYVYNILALYIGPRSPPAENNRAARPNNAIANPAPTEDDSEDLNVPAMAREGTRRS